MLCFSLTPISESVGSGSPWEGAACDHLGLLSRSYKVVCNWLVPVLDLEAYERGHMVNQAQLPPAAGLSQLSTGSRAPQGLRPSAGFPHSSSAKGIPGGMQFG